MKIPEQMSLVEPLGEKVMLFTCETAALHRQVSTINLDSDMSLRSPQEVQNSHIQIKIKVAPL